MPYNVNVEQQKTARLEARVTIEQKALLQKAAALTGRSLTDFVVTGAEELARRTILEHQVTKLSARDAERFVEALLKPPEPSARLKSAADSYWAAINAGDLVSD